MQNTIYTLIISVLIISCNSRNDNEDKEVSKQMPVLPNIEIDSVKIFPHDTSAFTQGLQYYQGKLFESTGDYENSSIRIVNYKKGEIIKKENMGSSEIFGEGLTIFKNKIYQLTWKNHIVYVYDIDNIKIPKKTIYWYREGWGITNDSTNLIISDGTDILFFLDANSFQVVKKIQVIGNNQPIDGLNELEYINGFIYSNIFEKKRIIKIDPSNGDVVGNLDLTKFIEEQNLMFYDNPGNVLNGIAWDNIEKRILITGKRWPILFQAKLVAH